MNKVFELKYISGPHGDECTTYNVKLLVEKVTLRDFLLNLDKREWGTLYVKVPDAYKAKLDYLGRNEKYSEIKIEYKNGIVKTIREEYNKYLDYYIDSSFKNWANGGWSMMNYWIRINKN